MQKLPRDGRATTDILTITPDEAEMFTMAQTNQPPTAPSKLVEEKDYAPRTRNYQVEMFEESLRRNIIVAVRIFASHLRWAES